MSENQSSYRQIMKATSIFGGVQVINIIISIVRSKFVALWLGPAGMGIMGLLTSTLGLVSSITNFGLGTAAVRDISEANTSGNREQITKTLSVFRTLVWGTGLLGMIVVIALSPLLSQLTFGNYNYTLAFVILSVTLLIQQQTAGQAALLKGMRQIKWMAKAGIYSSLVGLVTTLPLYYFYGEQGIVPALVLTAMIVYGVQYYFSHKIKIETKLVPVKEAIERGKPMMRLGFMLSLSGLVTILASYIDRLFIARVGNVIDVGLFNAGFNIMGTYVGMIFTAMGADYYPRLSGVNQEKEKYNELINHQSETALLILSPLICGFLIFINFGVVLLYSQKFLPIVEMIHFSILGIYFKALSWSMAFLILAKGDSKAFLRNELIASIYLSILNCSGYYLDGLRGLGISFLIGYFVYFVQIYFFIKIKYGFAYNTTLPKILLLQIPLGLLCFAVYYFTDGWVTYFLGSLLILCSAMISLYRMNKTMNIIELIKSKLKK